MNIMIVFDKLFRVLNLIISFLIGIFNKISKKMGSIKSLLNNNKTSLVIGIIASAIVAIVFLYIPPQYISENDETLTAEDAKIIEELIVLSDSTTNFLKDKNEEDYKKLIDMIINKLKLKNNPYNANAHMTLGQMYMTFGDYRGALNEYRKAANIDKTFADPHFGIAYVYYDLAIIDMLERDLYEISQPGIIYVEKIDHSNNDLPIVYYPGMRIYPDERTITIFDLALNEFNKGMTLQQFIKYDNNKTVVFFPPEELAEFARSTRRLLGLEPISPNGFENDDPIIKRFSWLFTDINREVIVFQLKSKDGIIERRNVSSSLSEEALITKLINRKAIYFNNTPINETVERQLLESILLATEKRIS